MFRQGERGAVQNRNTTIDFVGEPYTKGEAVKLRNTVSPIGETSTRSFLVIMLPYLNSYSLSSFSTTLHGIYHISRVVLTLRQ